MSERVVVFSELPEPIQSRVVSILAAVECEIAKALEGGTTITFVNTTLSPGDFSAACSIVSQLIEPMLRAPFVLAPYWDETGCHEALHIRVDQFEPNFVPP